VVISEGAGDIVDDPTDDIHLLEIWITEGTYKGLWLSGNNIACDFWTALAGPKPAFLIQILAVDQVYCSYRTLVGHDPYGESCRDVFTVGGRVTNDYSVKDSLRVHGSGCPEAYNFDVIDDWPPAAGLEHVALMYDDVQGCPLNYGCYASVDHIFKTINSPYDTVRTKIDGFSLHLLSDNLQADGGCTGADNIAFWMQDVLGGNNNKGYFYDRAGEFQYCPPQGPEDPTLDVPHGGARYANALFQNYPNPFRGGSGTTIHFTAAKAREVEVRIFDAAGRLVRRIVAECRPGDNYTTWNGRDDGGRRVGSGVYFYQVVMGGFSSHKKMLLVN
jgi:hypothetical protein